MHRDIVVIGASLGGLEALPRLVEGFGSDLRAAVLVVMHIFPEGPSYLPEWLSRAGSLPAAAAVDGERILPGRVYVAIPNCHLMVDAGHIRLSGGPRESHARPCVDVLFRSAAFNYGRRVIGVVLTGMLDDGTAGLWAIKDRGGMAIVQSPEEAVYPSMPLSASRHVRVDYMLRVAEMPDVISALAEAELPEREGTMPSDKLAIENRIALQTNAGGAGVRSLGQPSFYTCPDCHGSMIAIQEGSIKRYRCHTGHGYTADALAQEGFSTIESTLYSALAQLEERQTLLGELERSATERSDVDVATGYAADAERTRGLAERLRDLTRDPALRMSLEIAPGPLADVS